MSATLPDALDAFLAGYDRLVSAFKTRDARRVDESRAPRLIEALERVLSIKDPQHICAFDTLLEVAPERALMWLFGTYLDENREPNDRSSAERANLDMALTSALKAVGEAKLRELFLGVPPKHLRDPVVVDAMREGLDNPGFSFSDWLGRAIPPPERLRLVGGWESRFRYPEDLAAASSQLLRAVHGRWPSLVVDIVNDDVDSSETFSWTGQSNAPPANGALLLCRDVAARIAFEQRHMLDDEASFLVRLRGTGSPTEHVQPAVVLFTAFSVDDSDFSTWVVETLSTSFGPPVLVQHRPADADWG